MFYRFFWFLFVWLLRIIFPVKIINKKKFIKKGRCVGICNHFSVLDVPVIASSFWRQFHFIAKKELLDGKSSGKFLKRLGTIRVDREKMDLSTLKTALGVLKDEELLMLFPEGTRNKANTEVQSVKAGAAMFSIKGKAPILPMALYCAPRVFKRTYLLIGDPIDMSEYFDRKLKPVDREEAGSKIFNALNDLNNELKEIVENKKRKKKKNDNNRKI